MGYKAGALAEGLERSDSEMVAVFDADFIPDPGFLSSLLIERRPFDDPTVAFAQARWAWGAAQTGSWLARALALPLDRHFLVQKPTRAYHGNVTTFNGSGGIWRRAAIDQAGGWTADTLTEDLDLSYRVALAGWRGAYIGDVEVLNELPGNVRAFKVQQRRWAKGTTQCLRKLVGRVVGGGDRVADKIEEIFLLAGYSIHSILLACLLLWPWAVTEIDRTTFWILQGFMALGITAATGSLLLTVIERERRLTLVGATEVVAGLAIGVGMMVNNTVGQLQGVLASGGEFARTPKRAIPLSSNGHAAPASGGADGRRRRKRGSATDTADPGGVPGEASVPTIGAYRAPLHWTFYLELAAVAYCLWAATLLVQAKRGVVGDRDGPLGVQPERGGSPAAHP